MRTNGCPSPAELAKFLDAKLSASEARRLRVHVAECESCQEVVSEAMVFLEGEAGGESEEPMEAEAQPHPFPVRGAVRPAVGEGSDPREESTGGGLATPGRWLPLAAAVILALGLAAAWWLTSRPAGDLEALAGAQGDHRQTLVRLGGFPHAPPEPVQRSGSGGDEPAYALLAEAARLKAQAEEDPTAGHLHALGLAHLMLGRYDDAVATLERAGEATGDPDLERRIETDLAAALLEQGLETGQARTVARAHELLAGLVEERPDPDLLFNTALALEELGARRTGIETWDRYLEADPDSPWSEEARRRRARLVEMEEAEPEESAESIEDRVLINLLAQLDQLDPAASAEASSLAEEYARHKGDSWLLQVVASVDNGVGKERTHYHRLVKGYAEARVARVQDRTTDCLEASHGGLSAQKGSHPVILGLALLRGSCAYLQKDLTQASQLGLRVFEAGSAREFPVLAGQGAWLAGLVAHSQGNIREAIHLYEASQQHLRRSGDHHRLATLRSRLVDLYAFAGRIDDGWTMASAALSEEGQSAKRRHQTLHSAADLALVDGLLWTRHRFLLEAARMDSEVPAHHRIETWRALGRLYGQLGKRADAYYAFELGETALELITDPALLRRSRAFLDADIAAFLAEHDPTTANDRLLSASSFKDSAADLKYDLALTRSKVALSQGDVRAAEEALLEALNSVMLTLDGLDYLEERAALHQARILVLRAYVEFLIDRGREVDAFRAILRSQGRVLTGGTSPLVGIPTKRSNAISIIFFSLEDELLIWRAGGAPSGLALRRVPVSRVDLANLIARVCRWAGGEDGAGGRVAGLKLADYLFEPEDLEADRLLLTPDEVTAQIPFAVLPHPSLGSPLIHHLNPVIVPVLTQGEPERQPSMQSENCVLLIEGAGSGGANLPGLKRLHYIDEELSQIESLYSCSYRARTREEVLAAFINKRVDLVHYAGHGIEGASGGLLLNGKDQPVVFSWKEVEALSLNRVGVVLSACSGAHFSPGHSGLATLSHAFLQAGATTVVATRWPVVEKGALGIAVEIHRHHSRGVDLLEALRRSQMAASMGGNHDAWAGWVALRRI